MGKINSKSQKKEEKKLRKITKGDEQLLLDEINNSFNDVGGIFEIIDSTITKQTGTFDLKHAYN